MILFQCDYNEGAHPKILERLAAANMEQTPGYGEDAHCAHAAELIRRACEDDTLAVHFLVGGTQTNMTVIDAALRPHQGVIAAQSGHINVHETGAVESLGHKVLAVSQKDGKLSAAQVEELCLAHLRDASFEHMVQPKMVYISNPTEYGTLYSRNEMEELGRVCRKLACICSWTVHGWDMDWLPVTMNWICLSWRVPVMYFILEEPKLEPCSVKRW